MSNIGRNRKVFVLHSNDSSRHGASRPTLTELRCKRCKGIKDSTKKYHFFTFSTNTCVYFVLMTPSLPRKTMQAKISYTFGIFLTEPFSFTLTFIDMVSKQMLSLSSEFPYLISMFTRYRKHHKTSPRYLPRPFHLHLPKKWELQVHICVCYSFKYCFSK